MVSSMFSTELTVSFCEQPAVGEKLNWATGIDASGRPVLSSLIPTKKVTHHPAPASLERRLVFTVLQSEHRPVLCDGLENCNLYFPSQSRLPRARLSGTGTKHPVGKTRLKILLALSPSDGKKVWQYPQAGHGNSWGGTLTTAGGLVFFADDAESLEAVDAETGRALWHFNTGQSFAASPMTYAVNGVQYVAISAGSDVFSFALPH
jgi:alcohol dehydrogenase (cytochrome c)